MSGRRGLALGLGGLVLCTLVLWWFFGRRVGAPGLSGRNPPGAVAGTMPKIPPPHVAAGSGEGPSPIADALNASDGSIRRDLEIVSELFVAWLSNFPRDGNPVGENAEITAALAGDNRLNFAFIPRGHPAINGRGEMCDRWGTPFRFHQVSGQHMEIRSAGPDRKFATPDDALWPPEAPR